jgi:uncharacterized protein
MRLELESLDNQGEFAHVYQPNELSLEESDVRLIEPAEVRGRARRKGEQVELAGSLSAKVETLCARCLKPVTVPIATEFTERFVRAVSWRSEEQHELAREDLDLAVFEGQSIDLDQLVREEILLTTPTQVLCSEDCRGLCPTCGVDLNVKTCDCHSRQVDLRWEKLKDLRF